MGTTRFNNKIEGFQKNTKSLTVIVYDPSNNLYDLTGYDAFLYGKKYPVKENAALDISLNKTSIDPSNGAILFDFTENDLDLEQGDYIYEVIIDDSSTNRITVVQDRLSLLDSIL